MRAIPQLFMAFGTFLIVTISMMEFASSNPRLTAIKVASIPVFFPETKLPVKFLDTTLKLLFILGADITFCHENHLLLISCSVFSNEPFIFTADRCEVQIVTLKLITWMSVSV
jgi:hypothetical protein